MIKFKNQLIKLKLYDILSLKKNSIYQQLQAFQQMYFITITKGLF